MSEESQQLVYHEGLPVFGIEPCETPRLVDFFFHRHRILGSYKGLILGRGAFIPIQGFKFATIKVIYGKPNHWGVVDSSQTAIKWEAVLDPVMVKKKGLPESYVLYWKGEPFVAEIEFIDQQEGACLVIWNGYQDDEGRWESVGNNCVTWKQIDPYAWRIWAYGGLGEPTMDSLEMVVRLHN